MEIQAPNAHDVIVYSRNKADSNRMVKEGVNTTHTIEYAVDSIWPMGVKPQVVIKPWQNACTEVMS